MDAVDVIDGYRGECVRIIEREIFTGRENHDSHIGQLIITFESGRILRLDVGPNAESLVAFSDNWHDPFEGKLDAENADYLVNYGRFVLQRVDCDYPFVGIAGMSLHRVSRVRNQFGSLSGAKLQFDGGIAFYVLTAADEAWVLPGDFDLSSWDMSS